MLFDRLCKIAERALPSGSMSHDLRNAALFDMRGHDIDNLYLLGAHPDCDQAHIDARLWCMPFRNVVVETEKWLFLVHQPYDGDDRTVYVTFFRTDTDGDYLLDSFPVDLRDMGNDRLSPGMQFGIGQSISIDMRTMKTVRHANMLERSKTVYAVLNEPDWHEDAYLNVIHDLVDAALHMLAAINTPKKWVMRQEPASLPKKTKKIPRSDHRPRYLLISDKERQKYFRGVRGEKKACGEREPHPRRAHWRTLPTGKRVRVRACWVGPKETVLNGIRYKICLDL